MTLSSDVSSHVQPRFSSRRERKPGARERHSLQRCRLSPEPRSYSPCMTPSPRPHTVNPQSTYHVTAAADTTGRHAHTEHADEIQTSHYKELSTIEDIRADIKSKEKKGTPRKHIPVDLPDWLLDLDINLDVSAVDVVPPFETAHLEDNDETFLEMPTLSIADDTQSDVSSRFEELPVDEHVVSRQEVQRTQQTPRSASALAVSQEPRPDSSFSRTQSHHTFSRSGPRRYQGDKRVMSLQQGGIRSTPMQPKSKKFINQMITYQHMKVHDKKLKKVKPAVDTKMPATFKMALDRKRLVETRLSESWTGSCHSLSSSSRASPSPSRTYGTASR